MGGGLSFGFVGDAGVLGGHPSDSSAEVYGFSVETIFMHEDAVGMRLDEIWFYGMIMYLHIY